MKVREVILELQKYNKLNDEQKKDHNHFNDYLIIRNKLIDAREEIETLKNNKTLNYKKAKKEITDYIHNRKLPVNVRIGAFRALQIIKKNIKY